jgi:hypothetical protein
MFPNFFQRTPQPYHLSTPCHVPGEHNRHCPRIGCYWQAELRLLDVFPTLDFGFWALDMISASGRSKLETAKPFEIMESHWPRDIGQQSLA